jgi:hypothetical protein
MITRRLSNSYAWIRVAPLKKGRSRTPRGASWDVAKPAVIAEADIPVQKPDRFSFAAALAETGVPGTDQSPEEELVELLLNAADVEHGLMLQYLYATYSLKELLIAGTLRSIAIEEMGHFITVQNMLVACGAEPYVGHSDWNTPNLFHPFPFRLEPASVGSIAKYSIAEIPDRANVPPDILTDLPTLIAEADAAAGSPIEPHRVGLLYAKIYWLLRPDDHPLQDPNKEPWLGFPVAEMAAQPELAGRHVRNGFVTDARSVNAQPNHWQGNYTNVIVAPISDREVALSAVAGVSAQGEGFGETPQGHFERFVEAWRLARRSSDLSLLVPVNPWYATSGTSSPTGEEISSVDGRQFAQMGDGLYELLLLCTAANLLLPCDTTPGIRSKAAKAAILTMRDCLGAVGRTLTTIPLTDVAGTGKVCGLPFAALPIEVEGNLRAVIDRAFDVVAALKLIVADVCQGNAEPTLKVVADGIGTTLDEEITPRLTSLPV